MLFAKYGSSLRNVEPYLYDIGRYLERKNDGKQVNFMLSTYRAKGKRELSVDSVMITYKGSSLPISVDKEADTTHTLKHILKDFFEYLIDQSTDDIKSIIEDYKNEKQNNGDLHRWGLDHRGSSGTTGSRAQ